jgi:phosphoribosylglycinamide formyltransferase-1
MELRIGFLASGRGSNLEAIMESITSGELDAWPKVLIGSKPNAPVVGIAEEYGLPCVCMKTESLINEEEFLLGVLREYNVNLVVLAGYIRKLGDKVLAAYPNRILNIHPSLLPKYGGKGMYGMKVHEAVISSKDAESGAKVHIVSGEYDSGRILMQYKVPRFENDTAETLSDRVLSAEHALYKQTLKEIQKGIISLD